MCLQGLNVARLNFSHGTHEEHQKKIDMIKAARAVFVATCEGSQIDDIIGEIHNTGLEIVSLHDRPEGSRLGRYHYVIEVEDEAGITDVQIETVSAMEGLRFAGRFQAVEKDPKRNDDALNRVDTEMDAAA